VLPLFQFCPVDMTVKPCVADALRELNDVFDDWSVALWFATPNVWLGDSAPAETVM
jgi:hypothetical protein